MTHPNTLQKISAWILSTAMLLCAQSVLANAESPERRFAYTRHSLTQPFGEIELETWGTWKNRSGSLRSLEFSHELEIGLTQHTQLGFSVATWTVDARSGESRFADTSIEVIHNFTSPITNSFGSAVAAEVAVGERSVAAEGKLILEKRFGHWVLGWNGAIEAEWEGDRFGDLQESTGELTQSIGIAYDIAPCLSVGLEALQKMPLERWHAPANAEVYAGPSMTFSRRHFRATVAALFQATDHPSEPSMQLRTVLGIEF